MTSRSSESLQEEENANAIRKKLIATRNVIKNKFHKAYADRIEHENKLKQTIRPTTTSTKTSADKNNKEIDNNIISFNNPNEMCERLRKLISTSCEDDVKQVEEMKAIIKKLHEQEILE